MNILLYIRQNRNQVGAEMSKRYAVKWKPVTRRKKEKKKQYKEKIKLALYVQ
jgi:hypothetical protein